MTGTKQSAKNSRRKCGGFVGPGIVTKVGEFYEPRRATQQRFANKELCESC